MKKFRKVLALTLCAAALVGASVMGTMAYLTDNDEVTNTFTVGNVDITLDEAKVDKDGKAITGDGAERVIENSYKLLPGHTYAKDPTVTVEKGSEKAYVRMIVTLNYATELKAILGDTFLPQNFIEGWDAATWQTTHAVKEDNVNDTLTYEFRYKNIVDASGEDVVLESLFDTFTLPGTVTNAQLATLVTKDGDGKITDQFEITVTAHAIQADGFDSADKAWTAFGEAGTPWDGDGDETPATDGDGEGEETP